MRFSLHPRTFFVLTLNANSPHIGYRNRIVLDLSLIDTGTWYRAIELDSRSMCIANPLSLTERMRRYREVLSSPQPRDRVTHCCALGSIILLRRAVIASELHYRKKRKLLAEHRARSLLDSQQPLAIRHEASRPLRIQPRGHKVYSG